MRGQDFYWLSFLLIEDILIWSVIYWFTPHLCSRSGVWQDRIMDGTDKAGVITGVWWDIWIFDEQQRHWRYNDIKGITDGGCVPEIGRFFPPVLLVYLTVHLPKSAPSNLIVLEQHTCPGPWQYFNGKTRWMRDKLSSLGRKLPKCNRVIFHADGTWSNAGGKYFKKVTPRVL